MEGILGKKLGMTQIFTADGATVQVTVVQAGPCIVTALRTAELDGYEAVQLGFVEAKPPRHVTKAQQGNFKKIGAAPMRKLAEFKLDEGETVAAGDQVKVSIFKESDFVDVVGTSKGKGFQGVVKRHGFRGGRATHGSMFHRAPGSIGASSFPSRVVKGMRMAGHMGADRVTVRNLKVLKVDADNNLLLLEGAVPGGPNAVVVIRKAVAAKVVKVAQVEPVKKKGRK